ncbi:MAG: PKD domain-containing protein [Bacteroidetes bacterium]|nr:PKD domain-containing protein [Bacteroidota bacterium]
MVKRIKLFVPLIFSTLFFIDQVNAQCAATFTSTAGANNTYSFQGTALPSNTTVSYSWNYGDGAIGNGSVVTHQYNSSGIFTVTLNIMTTAPSCSATISQTINAIQCPINSNFSYTINTGGVVNFSNTSTGTTSNTSVYWFFGDGNFAGPSNTASYTYTNNGTYSASVYLTDSVLGCADSIAFAITISGLPCNLSAGFTSSTINGSEYFSNTSTPNFPTPTCAWNFGDGTTGTVFSPVHTYSASGTYTVLLTISQGTCASSFSSAVTTTIAAPPPPCSVTANFTYTLGSNGSVSFSNTSTGVSTTTFVTNWNFGNGNYAYANNTPTYTFTSNGTYSVALTVVDSSYACSDSIMIPITISNVTCGLNPTYITVYASQANNGAATFYSNMSNTTNLLLWNFGNGATSTATTPSTTYSASGIYTITLSVTNATNSACSTLVTQTISIYYFPCTYSASFTSTLTGNTLNVTNTTSGTSPNPYYLFNWGDGNYSGSITVVNASHTYSINGTYTVFLSAGDSTNFMCKDSTAIVINITNATPCSVNSNYSLQKDNTQLYSWFAYPANYGSNVASVIWTWGDGTSSTTPYPSHTYSAVGWYNICQTVSLTCGSQSTTCYNNYLNKTAESNAVVFIQVVNPVTGINNYEATKKNVSIEPNPNNGEFTLNFNGFQSADPLEILIYNAYGELINKNVNTLTSENGIKKIDLSNFPNGCYIVTIKNTNTVISRKLIINR